MVETQGPAVRQPGLPLSRAGGLPRPIGPVDAATGKKKSNLLQPIPSASLDYLSRVDQVTPSLAAILRPQAAYRWLLPYLSAITPLYVESTLRGGLAGNHVQAWELFDLMIDTNPEISACVQEYCEGVLSHKIVVEADHEEDEEPTPTAIEKQKLISAALRGMRPVPQNDENAIRGTIRDLLFARFHGQSVCEVDWSDWKTGKPNFRRIPGQQQQALLPRSTFWVHPVCYAYSVEGTLGLRASIAELQQAQLVQRGSPAQQMRYQPGTDRMPLTYAEPPAWNWITSQPRPSDLAPFPDNKFLISTFKSKAGTALGGSCLRPLAAWWVFSNFCGDYLMNLAQICGIPFRSATVNPNAPEEVKREIRQMMQSMGHNTWAVLPEGSEVNFANTGVGAGGSPQAFLIHLCDSYMRKVILHQTMTGGAHDSMGKGGGKAFGEVEDDTKDQCIETGCRFAEEQINLQLVPMILAVNYGGDDYDSEMPQVKLVDSAVGGLADAQTLQVVSQLIDVPDSFTRRMFGIPKLSAQDEISGVDQGQTGAQQKEQARQFDAGQQAQADQANANRTHQLNLAKEQTKQAKATGAPQPGQNPKQPGQQEPQPESGDVVESRRALEAATSKTSGKGCLMAMLPKDEVDRFVKWTEQNIPASTLTADGIEQEPHVTTYYGFNLGFDTTKLTDLLKRRTPATFTLGSISRFECHDYDVLKVDVDSDDLEKLHSIIDKRFADDVTPSEHDYHPHLTLAYVTKGSNKELDGQNPFEGEQFKVDSLLFSEPEHTNRKTIPLEAKRVTVSSQASSDVASALNETAQPILERIEAISKVKDKTTRVKMMKKLLKDMPHIAAAMAHDDSMVKAFAPEVVKRFVKKLVEEFKK